MRNSYIFCQLRHQALKEMQHRPLITLTSACSSFHIVVTSFMLLILILLTISFWGGFVFIRTLCVLDLPPIIKRPSRKTKIHANPSEAPLKNMRHTSPRPDFMLNWPRMNHEGSHWLVREKHMRTH